MRKIRVIKYVGIALVALYVASIILASFTSLFGDYVVTIFSIILASISLYLFYKGAVLKSYSTLWFGLCLILYALCILAFEIWNIRYENYSFLFAFLPIVPSVLMLAFGRAIYLKVIIFNFSIALPLLIFNYVSLNLWLKIGVFTISIALGILVSRCTHIGKEII